MARQNCQRLEGDGRMIRAVQGKGDAKGEPVPSKVISKAVHMCARQCGDT